MLAAFALALAPQGADAFVLPDGLEITLWAETPQLYNPTAIDVDARGRVWVTEAVNYRRWQGRNPGFAHANGGGDRVVILEDRDGDGRCDASKVFVQEKELVAPLGICILGKQVLVSCSPDAILYTDENGDDVPDRREVLLTGFGGHDHDHGLHSFVPGPDGRLWFTAGNAGPHLVTDRSGWRLRSGSVYDGGGATQADNKPGLVSDDGRIWTGGLALRVGLDGRGLSVFAHNFRNNYELALDSFGNVFQSDNDDDGNEGCRTSWLMEGGNYGYFSSDGSRTWDADRRPGQASIRAQWHSDDPGVLPPGCVNGAGGPTGVTVYEGDLMPQLRGAVLDCDAGRGTVWIHRPRIEGAGIVLDHGVLVALSKSARDQAAPWHQQFGQRELSWFRPSDVAVGVDGSIFVADWYDPGVGGHAAGDRDCYGRIFRIAPKGSKPSVPKELSLRSPAPSVRFLAQQTAGEKELRSLAEGSDPRFAARALFLLARKDPALVEKALGHSDPEIRIAALRALRAAGRDPLPALERLARDESPLVRAEVAASLRDVPFDRCAPLLALLAERLDPNDRFAVEAFGLACDRKEEAAFALLAEKKVAALPAIAWRLHPKIALPFLTARAGSGDKAALDAIAFIPQAEAADAMHSLALTGPEELRSAARAWLRQRATNDWRGFGLGAVAGHADRSRAERRFASGLVKAGTRDVEVDVTGARSLFLVVNEGKNGNGYDWADWIEPRLVGPKGELRLVDLPWLEASAAWGEVRIGKNCDGGPLRVDGKDVAWGIGAHANSEISWLLPEGFTRFTARAAPDDGGTKRKGSTTELEFEVYVEVPPDRAPLLALEKTATDAAASADARAAAVAKLAADPEGGRFLLRLAEKGELDPALRAAAAQPILANPDLGVRALASGRFSAPTAEKPDLARIAALTGDARRGAQLFLGKEAACVTCHRFRGRGGDIGPDLTSIRTKYAKPALLDAIVNPSAGIAIGYDSWLVSTKDGRMLTGFILADGAQLLLKDTQGERHAIPSEQVAEKVKQTISSMPEGLASGQSTADLAAFLLEDRDAPPLFGEERVLFNGRDLTGWTFHVADAAKKMEDVWSVRDGMIVCKGEPAGYLKSVDDFESFRLTLEWSFDPRRPGNSGVLMRMTGRDQVWPRSIEAQLMDRNAGDIWNIGDVPMLTDPARTDGRRTAKLAPCSERPHGEWNRYVITLRGGDLTLEVNGVLQNRASWCEEVPGKICLQSEGAEIRFRDIRLRPILR